MEHGKNPIKKLNPRHKFFCEAYLRNKFNATSAAIEAGYALKNARTIASSLMANPNIKRYIEERIKSLLSDTEKLTLEWVQSVANIMRADIRNVVTWDEDHLRLTPSDIISDETAYGIQEVTETITEKSVNRTVKLESKTKALELMGRYLSLLSDNQSSPDNETEEERISRDERKQLIAALMKKA